MIIIADSFDPPVTSYTNTGGQGNRTSLISVSSNIVWQGGVATNLVDGDLTANATHAVDPPSTSADGDYVRLTFSSRFYIDEVTLLQSAAGNHGAFTMMAGDTVGSLITPASFTFTGTNVVVPLVGVPPEGFFIYQVTKSGAGTWSATPWWVEILLKIAPGV